MNLPERLLAIDEGLGAANLDHAFGGAIALAYWTLDPRATSDIDVNIFIGADRAEEALAALPNGVEIRDDTLSQVQRDEQIRLWWEGTPVDLFFSYADLHKSAARNRRRVPFAGSEIPVLGPVELATFKAIFNRTKDWADIEAMIAAETLDPEAVRSHLVDLVGVDDERVERLHEAVRRASTSPAGDRADSGPS